MKKINTLFLMIFLIVGTLGFVVAGEDSEEYKLPEAQEIGFFENAFDNMGLAFTFNREKKIQKALELAEKRLAEAEVLAEKNPEAAEKARERYNNFVAKAEEALAKISNARAENENLSIKEVERIVRIQNKFEQHRENTARIYIRALERFEVNNASDEKIERFENFYDQALNRSDVMEDRLIRQREAIIERHKILSEESDEELNETLWGIEEEEGLIQSRAERAERAEVRVQNVMKIKNRNIERAKELLNEGNLSNEQKEQIANRIKINEQNAMGFEIKAHERIEAHKNLTPIAAEPMLSEGASGNSNN